MRSRERALCLGKFDALHRGHAALVAAAAGLGERVLLLELTGMSTVLGWPPRPPLLAPADRSAVVAAWSREHDRPLDILSLDFAAVRDWTPADFVTHLVEDHDISALVCGGDFRFGRDRAGGVEELALLAGAAGIDLTVIAPVKDADGVVSSTRVRAALIAGEVTTAQALLGRPYRLRGTVSHGEGRGRGLGFPTANLGPGSTLLPADGVYAARATVAGAAVPAAVNVGVLPTVGGRQRGIEAHLIGWRGDCYGAELVLDLLARLRGEQRFPSLTDLRQAIAADVAAATRVVAQATAPLAPSAVV